MRRTIYFDLETTGRDPHADRIVEIAAYDVVNKTSFQRLVNPGMRIPSEASRINGITDEMVKNAPSFAIAGKEFLDFTSGEVMLVAHNGELFDWPFLQSEFKRHSIPVITDWILVDSLKWARKFRRDLPRHALQYLREQFGIAENNAHRALDDVMILYKVFSLLTDDLTPEEIIERIESLRIKIAPPSGKEDQVCILDLF